MDSTLTLARLLLLALVRVMDVLCPAGSAARPDTRRCCCDRDLKLLLADHLTDF